ncbi:MAG: sigma-70 family RNA polymerase sigma factor [Candidatus Solibacter sp.]|jgi:RNA polymerase sigma-70 factor (ECF subfamily)
MLAKVLLDPRDVAAAQRIRREKATEFVSALYPEWYGLLVRYAFRAGVSLQTAEDVVQEAFVELYVALLEGKVVENPKGWMLCVVRRRIIDWRRRESRHGGAFLPLSAAGAATERSHEEFPAEWVDTQLTRLLAVLSRREEEVVLLRASALKYSQIAARLQISSNSVKTLLVRAIRKMRLARGAATYGQQDTRRYDDSVPETLQ